MIRRKSAPINVLIFPMMPESLQQDLLQDITRLTLVIEFSHIDDPDTETQLCWLYNRLTDGDRSGLLLIVCVSADYIETNIVIRMTFGAAQFFKDIRCNLSHTA